MHTPKIARRTLIVNAGLGTALGAGFSENKRPVGEIESCKIVTAA